MNEIIFVATETPECGYIARALSASIVTEADELPQLRNAVREAVGCHFGDADRPAMTPLHFTREEIVAA